MTRFPTTACAASPIYQSWRPCLMTSVPWLPIFQIWISLSYYKFGVSFSYEWMNVCLQTHSSSETITGFLGPGSWTLSPSSRQNSSDLQHWNEEQDEGTHHDGRCYLLEVDLPQHSCPCDWQCRLPLEHGGWLSARESLWPPLQPGRLPDYQLPHWRQAEMAPAHRYLSPGKYLLMFSCVRTKVLSSVVYSCNINHMFA